MRFSVVINTYNRGPSLRRTLAGLRHQTYKPFEVVVVNGPSSDATPAVLAEFAGAVRVGSCPEAHLGRSRNVGVALAAGDAVAFLDDDAIPEPTWLEELAAAYDSPRVGGAGGVVLDHTGFRPQFRFASCDRVGNPDFRAAPPFDHLNCPGADPFLYLQGTNCSFRRRCLVEIGGFDEEIEYYLDEVEVCLRVLDLGYELRALDGAAVHHKYLASHLRTPAKVVLNPYPLIKNRTYFALINGRRTRPLRDVLRSAEGYAAALRAECAAHHAAGRLTTTQRDHFLTQVARGLRDGRERGLAGVRLGRSLPPASAADFLPFPTLRPEGKRSVVCFASLAPDGSPPAEAVAFAARGHEVHAVGVCPGSNRIDLESGVWTHRLAPPARYIPELDALADRDRWCRAAAVYQEVCRISTRRPLDAVHPGGDSLICDLDPRLAICSAGTNSPHGPLADLMVGAGLVPQDAARAAAALLDPARFPVDPLGELCRLWPLADDAFLEGVYPLLLGRDLDAAGRCRFLTLLRGGLSRWEVVAYLAGTREAADAGLPLDWLAQGRRALGAEPAPGRRPLRARARVALTRLLWRLRGRLRRAG